MVILNTLNCFPPSHSDDVSDYVAVDGEIVTFSIGESRVCHTIDISQDIVCEAHPENEYFFSDLTPVTGTRDITIDPPTAQVIINDLDEPECRKSQLYNNLCHLSIIQRNACVNRYINASTVNVLDLVVDR